VLDRRLGIPITLATVYLLVGRRLGLPLMGINMPGHFLLRWQSATTHFFVDAFNEGRILSEKDCRAIAGQMGLAVSHAHLVPAAPRQILLRMCRNLQAIYKDTDPARAEQFGRFIALLSHG
jgi:regulator of sirC expression with transglutaminase-like and TPR domain